MSFPSIPPRPPAAEDQPPLASAPPPASPTPCLPCPPAPRPPPSLPALGGKALLLTHLQSAGGPSALKPHGEGSPVPGAVATEEGDLGLEPAGEGPAGALRAGLKEEDV